MLKPDIHQKVLDKQQRQVDQRNARAREFQIGQSVSVRDYRATPSKWITGMIHERTGPLSYKVKVGDAMATSC